MFRAILLSAIAIFSLVSFKPKKTKTPPGTVFLKENLFIDKVEVTNVAWREFEYWNLAYKRDTAFYWQMMQDTTVWGDIASAFQKYYHNHPSYNYYPVVGITYEQAIEFCKWRTDRINELFSKEPKNNPFPGKKYLYRLPTAEEWEFAASGKLDIAAFPFGYEDTIGKKGPWKSARLFNYKHEMRAAYMSPVNSFPPNGYGIHNMIGNVSEIVAEKGLAKGGNYSLPLEQCKIPGRQAYNKPEEWLGFRCVCEIVD